MDYTSVCILNGFMGFSNNPIVPFWYIYSVEVAYPLKETTVVGLVRALAVLIAISSGYLCNYFVRNDTEELICYIVVAFMAIFTVIGLLLAMLIRPINYEEIRNGDICKFDD